MCITCVSTNVCGVCVLTAYPSPSLPTLTLPPRSSPGACSTRSDEAIDAYIKALEIKPNYVRALANLGIAYRLTPSPSLSLSLMHTHLTWTNMRTHTHTHTNTHTHTYMNACTRIHACIVIHKYIRHKQTHMWIHTYTQAHTYTHTHVHTYTRTHIHTYTHTYIVTHKHTQRKLWSNHEMFEESATCYLI
jgi:tetratricopeptide (TPR) repeat protein